MTTAGNAGVLYKRDDSAGGLAPTLSIYIPTFNRADLLDLCLERLAELNDVGLDFEVVVSDNCSTDDTCEVVRRRGAQFRRISLLAMKSNRGVIPNWQNAIRHTTGTFGIYLADDDRLIPDKVAAHIEVMLQRPELVATYADWIAYDDAQEREAHRYYDFLTHRCEFTLTQHFELVNFVLATPLLPEMVIARRSALLRALPFVKHGYPHLWYMYLMHRQGTIAFDPEPFYVENRIVKPHLARDNWQSMGLWLVGDEMRMTLEALVLRSYHDSGVHPIPAAHLATARDLIDKRLNARLMLEVQVAIANRNWILAAELMRRASLWVAPDPHFDMQWEIDNVVVPAALQSVAETFESLGACQICAFHGFTTSAVPNAFRTKFPHIRVEEYPGTPRNAHDPRYLHVIKDPAWTSSHSSTGHELHFDNLIDMYKASAWRTDLSAL